MELKTAQQSFNHLINGPVDENTTLRFEDILKDLSAKNRILLATLVLIHEYSISSQIISICSYCSAGTANSISHSYITNRAICGKCLFCPNKAFTVFSCCEQRKAPMDIKRKNPYKSENNHTVEYFKTLIKYLNRLSPAEFVKPFTDNVQLKIRQIDVEISKKYQ